MSARKSSLHCQGQSAACTTVQTERFKIVGRERISFWWLVFHQLKDWAVGNPVGHFLSDWQGSARPLWAEPLPLADGAWLCMKTGWAGRYTALLHGRINQLLPPGSHLVWFPALASLNRLCLRIHKPNKLPSPQVAFGYGVKSPQREP